MRLSVAILAIAFIAEQRNNNVQAFSLQTGARTKKTTTSSSSSSSRLFAEAEAAPAEKKPLTSADILARARKAAGMPEEELPEDGPQLFDDDMLDNMQQSLLILEKRVSEGPGSVSLLEIEEFQAMTTRILKDMKDKEQERLDDLASAPPAAEALTLEAAPAVEPAPAPAAQEESVTEIPPATEVVSNENSDSYHINEEEGTPYDGTGGMGLASGTTNTYVIPGMDEMSPEEYQKALQKTVSDHQATRKATGVYGNRATSDYLSNLNAGGGMVKK